MSYDRLQLFAASSLLIIVNACAPSGTVNSLAAEISGVPSGTEADTDESDRLFSFNLPKPSKSDVAYGSIWTVDGHFGVWFNEWSGISLDGPFSRAGDAGFNTNAASPTPLLLLRVQLLKSDNIPNGQLQPYIGLGPGLFFANQEMAFQRDNGKKLDNARMSVGIDLRAGMRWQLSRKLDFFSVYRMTSYKGSRGNHDKASFYSRENGNVTLTTNSVVGGLVLIF